MDAVGGGWGRRVETFNNKVRGTVRAARKGAFIREGAAGVVKIEPQIIDAVQPARVAEQNQFRSRWGDKQDVDVVDGRMGEPVERDSRTDDRAWNAAC